MSQPAPRQGHQSLEQQLLGSIDQHLQRVSKNAETIKTVIVIVFLLSLILGVLSFLAAASGT